MHLNHLLHNMVDKLPHHSELSAAELHAAVDLAVEPPLPPDPEETAAEEARRELEELRQQMAALQARTNELAPQDKTEKADAVAVDKKAAPGV